MKLPKDKAKELVDKFWKWSMMDSNYSVMPYAKQCALIAVDEILNNYCGSVSCEMIATETEIFCDKYYWEEVKTEIENL